MKAIKEIKEVIIVGNGKDFYWWLIPFSGLYLESKVFKSLQSCKSHFKRFAKLNGIKNYKFV
jgi:hypothetical protein